MWVDRAFCRAGVHASDFPRRRAADGQLTAKNEGMYPDLES
jgi:hypothetical protein